jgi:alkylation response protein AidB-like acyl-CoA dehydrogenase
VDFSLSEEQKMLITSARDLLQRECPPSLVRQMVNDPKGYPASLWEKMSTLGWLGLVFPTECNGGGGNFMDLAVLLQEMGRAALPSPFFTSVIMSGLYILDAGSREQKKRFLSGISSGEIVMTLALSEKGADDFNPDDIKTVAAINQDNYCITGTKLFVPYADSADYLLCVARVFHDNKDKGLGTFIVKKDSPGIRVDLLKTMGSDHFCKVQFKETPIQEVIGTEGQIWHVFEKTLWRNVVALCCDMIGGAQKVLDMTVEYSKSRVQFGRPIGSMQALQHHCSDMAVAIEAMQSLTLEAAWRVSVDAPFYTEASIAKSLVSEWYPKCTQLGMMIQGGISFMEDHTLPIYYRRAKALEVAFGNSDYHKEIIAQRLV